MNSSTNSEDASLKKPPIPRGQGSILLVDDEELLCSVGTAMLTNLGYEVTAVSDPKEALALFGSEPEAFDLVMLDMIMPKMNGEQVYEAMKEIHSEVRVVFASGFAHDQGVRQLLQQDNVAGFLQKPYRRRDLSQAIERALGRA